MEVFRRLGDEFQSFAAGRMVEPEAVRVERRAFHERAFLFGEFAEFELASFDFRKQQFVARAVHRIHRHRVADAFEMDADLVRAPGFYHRFGQCKLPKPLQCSVKSQRRFARIADDHPAGDVGVLADGLVDFPLVVVQHTVEQREVEFVGGVFFKLDGQMPVRGLRAGKTQHTARLAVEPMHRQHLSEPRLQQPGEAFFCALSVGDAQ